jgi:hypothetical protein
MKNIKIKQSTLGVITDRQHSLVQYIIAHHIFLNKIIQRLDVRHTSSVLQESRAQWSVSEYQYSCSVVCRPTMDTELLISEVYARNPIWQTKH